MSVPPMSMRRRARDGEGADGGPRSDLPQRDGHPMTSTITRAAAIGLCGLLAACAPDGQGGATSIVGDVQTLGGGSPAGQSPEQRLLAERQRDYARARVQSAAIGAVGGALLCQLRDCSAEETIGAAAAGGAVGYLAGGYLANQNRSFQADQETLRRDIQLAREDNQRLRGSVSAAQDVVSYQRTEIERLNAGLGAGTVTADQYRSRIGTMRGDLSATRSLIGTTTDRLGALDASIAQHARAGLPTGRLREQRSAQQALLGRLRAAEQAMIANIGRAPAEVRA